MEKIVPHESFYAKIKGLKKISSICLYISALISFFILIVGKFNFCLNATFNEALIIKLLNALLAFFSVSYFVLDVFLNDLFLKAELNRKKGLIDNSLNSRLSDKQSQGYFSNDTISFGLYKFGVNSFENSFFSKKISERMINKMIFKSGFILVLFLLVVFFTENEIITVIAKISLPFTIIHQTVRLLIYNKHIAAVFERYKDIFSNTDKSELNAPLLDNVLNQEMTNAWARTALDSNLYTEMNSDLSLEWEEIKKERDL